MLFFHAFHFADMSGVSAFNCRSFSRYAFFGAGFVPGYSWGFSMRTITSFRRMKVGVHGGS